MSMGDGGEVSPLKELRILLNLAILEAKLNVIGKA